MQTIAIANTDQRTTRLGFGCSGILGGTGKQESLRLLETAFDAGIRHFDCAPMYGFGTAEQVLGEFLQRHRGSITVTTKYGLFPQRRYSPGRAVRGVARLVSRVIGGRNPAAFSDPLRKASFTAEEARASLTRSLRQLRAECVDIFLLHEASANDLHDETLLHFLQDQVARGSIRCFGVGSSKSQLAELQTRRPEFCAVLQSEWSAGDEDLLAGSSFRITHRGLQGGWQHVYHSLCRSPETLSAWSDATGVDLAEEAIWPRLLLRACMAVHPSTMVLFSTRSASRIVANVAAAEDLLLTQAATCLHRLLQQQRLQHSSTHG